MSTESSPPADLFEHGSAAERRARRRVRTMLSEFRDRLDGSCALSLDPLPGSASNGDRARARMPAGARMPQSPMDFDRYVDTVVEDLIGRSVDLSSPRCLGHMSGVIPGFATVLGDVVTGLNQNLVKEEASRALTWVEREVLAIVHRVVFDADDDFYAPRSGESRGALGLMVSGGTLANITALWCARNACFPPEGDFAGIAEEGWPRTLEHHGCKDAVVLASALAHYSIRKATTLLGLGARNLVSVPVDARGRMRVDALEEAMDECAERGRRVMAIVGVAGTTDSGSIDPLSDVADIAQSAGAHFHVDAAWGAPLLFSEVHAPRLAGIERADTVTIDGHKQLFMPIGTSLLLFKDPRLAVHIEQEAEYMLRPDSGDHGRYSLEGSRPGNALFFHAALHVFGRRGLGELAEQAIDGARRFAAMVDAEPDFELLAEPETSIVLYRYLPAGLRNGEGIGESDLLYVNRFNQALQERQSRAGRTLVARTRLTHLAGPSGQPVVALRAVFVNPRTTPADLAAILADQRTIACGLQLADPRGAKPCEALV